MTSFVLKMIAALSMLLDHAGILLFGDLTILRILGRLAFPIYAWFIAEGFGHTRNRLRYAGRIFLLGVLCEAVYVIATGDWYLNTLITFSCSLLLMGTLTAVRAVFADPDAGKVKKWLSVLGLAALTASLFVLTLYVEVDYGFFGILVPVFTSLAMEKSDRLILFSAALFALCLVPGSLGGIQFFSLLAVPLLALYNGKQGKARLKWFFYIFYPAHFVLLYGIKILLNGGLR